jgi:hypothetical protein
MACPLQTQAAVQTTWCHNTRALFESLSATSLASTPTSPDSAGTARPGEGTLLLVVANYALPRCTPAVWRTAALRVVADGGLNRLYDELPALVHECRPEEVRRLCSTRSQAVLPLATALGTSPAASAS